MKIYNTLTKKIEKFESMKDREVGMYTCGPTVYDTAHIGNLRKYTCDDLLYRTLKFNGYNVKRVMNITDIDDKTINKSGGDHKKFDELTKMYEESFFADLDKLNITKPLPENITRATQYIEKMVLFIEDLLNKGYAYKGTDGSIYFSIEKFKNYGELAGLDRDNLKAGARVSHDEYTKENPADFALWKAWDTADGEMYWETRLGKGRPGWHIECSAMSMDKLGETIDIHTGGVDNIFPHHENEIAQSEARSGKKFVNFWVHNEHLMVDGKKMSKSAGNFYRLKDIEEKGFSPLDFRYFMIGAHYRSKVNFTWDGLESAKNTRERLMRIIEDLPKEDGKIAQEYLDSFKEKVSNDLNISEALAVLWSLLRDEKIPAEDKRITAIKMDAVLGLDLGKEKNIEVPAEIAKLAQERKIARENKDFKASDDLRNKINSFGWQIEDLADNEYRIEKING